MMVTVFIQYTVLLEKMTPTSVTNIDEAEFRANKNIEGFIP